MFDDDPDGNVGFLLHDVSRLLRTRFDRRARALGLTRAQWRVLAHLAPRQGINQSSLAEILEVENITLGRHIDRLEDTDWVVRRRDPGDRRAWRLFLTEKSRPVLDQMEVLATETQEEAMAGLPDGERDRLLKLLLTMKRNMAAREAETRAAADGGSEAPEPGALDVG
jgi:DNA-binding MarR family transcriptional regulator